MKTIGMIGGMSWESTRLYYEILNRQVQRRLGGVHSVKALLYSFDFGEMAKLQSTGRWDDATRLMCGAGETLARAGADFLIICCNTMHLMSDDVERAAGIPLLHIADPLGEKMKSDGVARAGLLGSCFTMEDDRIIKKRLADKFGIETMVPEKADAAEVDRVIQEEFVRSRFLDSSRIRYREIMARLVARGAQGIILGCTEIPLLVQSEDASVPLYDTTSLHALAAVNVALS
jgi:aspartate racemase